MASRCRWLPLAVIGILCCGVSASAPEWQSRYPKPEKDLCFSKGCINAASDLLNQMDQSVDPCQDFFSFACGSFVKDTPIPDDKSRVSQFSLIDDELDKNMRKQIGAPISAEDTGATVLAKKYFQSCMNKTRIEERGVKPLQNMLEKMGGWPVVEGAEWNATAFNWMDTIYQNRKEGFSHSYFFRFSVTADVRNYSQRLVDLDDASLGMGRKYLIKGFGDDDVQAYYNYMVEMAVLLGASPEKAKQEMNESLHLEIALANMMLPVEERRNSSRLYNKMTLKELSQEVPSIPWVTYSNRLLEDAGHQVSENETINVSYLTFLKNMTALLETTPKRVQANYLMWRIVRASVGSLHLAARDIRLKYYAKVYGTSEHKPRWKECLGGAMGSFSIAAGSLYVKKYFDEDAKAAALDMVKDLHKEFDAILDESTWMDEITKKRAKDKSKTIKYYIAYPDELRNDTLVTKHYEGLDISDSDLYQNNRNLNVFWLNYAYRKLREPVDKEDWRRHSRAAVVNAYYSSVENSIQFPAGILKGAFYESKRPKYLNYGAIGMVIGHEITHGFDDQGRQYNDQGELKDWWEPETNAAFKNKSQCIIDQYGNITVDRVGMQINGINTQGENIADNGGFKIAYRAYNRYQKENGREASLPGLHGFSNEQMFWLGVANPWCAVYKDDALKNLILTDPHAPSFLRINQPALNMPEFAADWKCPASARLNPQEGRCAVW